MSTAVATSTKERAEPHRPQTTNKSTEISTKVTDDAITRLESIATSCGLIALAEEKSMARAFKLAAGVRALRNAITDEMMDDLMDLMGTKLGFRTDRDREQKKYPRETVKECAIEALMRGARFVGNEFNIIADNCYLTKEFFQRIMLEMPGLTDVVLTPGVPMMSQDQKTAYVNYTGTWKYFGKPGRLDCVARKSDDGKTLLEDTRLSIRVNAGMGPDAILGKAERKFRARIYALLAGTNVSEGDVDDPQRTIVVESGASKSDVLRERLTGPTAPEVVENPEALNGLADALSNAETAEACDGVLVEFNVGLTTQQCTDLMTAVEARKGEIAKAAKK